MPESKKTILIIEDDPNLQLPLADRLRHEGFIVLKARNGKAGLSTALDLHPDLILLDVIIPEMDGLAMLDQLRKDPWGKYVAVVMLTNLSDMHIISQAVEKHAFDYIEKSKWSLDEIAGKIKVKLETGR